MAVFPFDTDMTHQKPDLSAAYALSSPEDSVRLYADWANSYDQGFAKQQAYILPEAVARAFVHAGGRGPVLDVGAGTGLCGEALTKLGCGPIDATDISPEMLSQALRKDVYRDVIEADLTEGVPVPRNAYAGIVSSGTFTHGHLGAEVLSHLLRAARPGSQFAISINTKHYDKQGFASAFDRLLRGQWIRNLTMPEVRMYGEGAPGEHGNDTALIALFQKS